MATNCGGATSEVTKGSPQIVPRLLKVGLAPSRSSCAARSAVTMARMAARSARKSGIAIRPCRSSGVPTSPQVAVEDDVCRRSLAVTVEVHEEEGKVVQRVDGRDGFIELDGVVESRPALPHHDIGQMQIPMAPAHEACGGALIQRCGRRADRLLNPRASRPSSGHAILGFGKSVQIDVASSRRGLSLTIGTTRSARFVRLMDNIGQSAREVVRYTCLPRDMAQQRRLVEPAHVHCPFDDVPVGAERECAFAGGVIGTQPR